MSGWPVEGLELRWFRPEEFDYPNRVDPDLLVLLDEVRARCGFPIEVTSDVRTEDDLRAIYGTLRDAPDSPHMIREDGYGHAVDVKPAGNLSATEFHGRKAEIFVVAYELGPRRRGVWENQGLELGSSHVHLDNDTKLRRPHYWGGKSR